MLGFVELCRALCGYANSPQLSGLFLYSSFLPKNYKAQQNEYAKGGRTGGSRTRFPNWQGEAFSFLFYLLEKRRIVIIIIKKGLIHLSTDNPTKPNIAKHI